MELLIYLDYVKRFFLELINIDKIKNKKIYLAPYNDLTISLSEQLPITLLGFIDSFKKSKNIFQAKQLNPIEYDWIIIYSPNYWYEISKQFPKEKVLIVKDNALITIDSYLKSLGYTYAKYDILFCPYNNAHVLDMNLIIKQLKKINLSVAVVISKVNKKHVTKLTDVETVQMDVVLKDFITFECFICFADWEPFTIKLIKYSKNNNVTSIGIVEGITEFTNVDYNYARQPYEHVDYVLTTGKNDLKYLSHKKTHIVGIPKMYHQSREPITFPKKNLVVINLNFVGLLYDDVALSWLNSVISQCKKINIDYVISQHPTDTTDIKEFDNVSNLNIYDCIKLGTVVVSRFSTVILESLAYGKPVVYFKPKEEKSSFFVKNKDVFSVVHDEESLGKSILYEISRKENTRERANSLLHNQCNINSNIEPSKLAAQYISDILNTYKIKG
jgi:hypothetical protein